MRLLLSLLLVGYGFLLALAGARVCTSALPTARKTADVSDAPEALNFLQALNVLSDLSAQVTFDDILFFKNTSDLLDLVVGEVLCAHRWFDLDLFKYLS